MSFLTKNTPNKKVTAVFEQLNKDELELLMRFVNDGNYGSIATAVKAAYKEKEMT